MRKINLLLGVSIFFFNIFSLAAAKELKSKLTLTHFDSTKTEYKMAANFKDFDVETKLEKWKCHLKNNKKAAQKIKNTMFANLTCSVGNNNFHYNFACGNDLVYESFELSDKNHVTTFQFECI